MPPDGTPSANHLIDFLAGRLADAETGWSLGTFGAIAEFTRDANEPAALHQTSGMLAVVTARGGLRIEASPEPRLVASELLTTESWSHRVALCLPHDACAMSRRTEFTEMGPDSDAADAHIHLQGAEAEIE